MIIIDENTVVVSNFSELKSVLEEANTYNYVYLNSDITLTSGTSAIYVSAVYPSKVIIKNMDVTGYNYYGIVYVPDSSTYHSNY